MPLIGSKMSKQSDAKRWGHRAWVHDENNNR